MRARVARADLSPLRAGARATALPVSYAGKIALKGDELAFNDIDATVAGAHLRGKLALTLGAAHRLDGELDADTIDGAGLMAAAIGMPANNTGAGAAWSWSSEPFAKGAFGLFSGQVALKAQRAELLPHQVGARFPRHAALRQARHRG